MISQPNAKQSPDEVDYQIQDLLLSYYKSYSDEQKAMAGFTIISQWPGSIKTFACVEAMLSCTMDAKNPASHCAREWLWKCPPGLVSAAKSLRHSFSEKTAESIRSSHLPGDHPIGNVTNPPDWPTLINHFNLRGFDYYPPINRPDLFAACEWLRGRFNKEDAQGITLMLSKLSRLAQMSKIRQKIGRTVLRGEAHYELLFNNIDLRSEWLNLLDYSPNTVEYNPDRKKENTQRFYLVRATLDHLPKMSKKEQQEIISRLVQVRHLWAYFYANRILGWAKKLFKPDHEFWQKLPDWLEGWANFEYDLMGSCHDLYFDCRKQPEEWSFCISHKPEKLQEIFGKLPAWISVAAIAKICQKGKENRDGYDPGNLLRPKFGEVEEFTKQINRDPAAARKHFEAALQYLTVSYAMAVSYGKVTKDDAALAKWWHPRRLVVTREACEQVAKSMVKNNLINPEIIQIRYVEGLVKSGYKLKPADINDEVVLYKLLARRYDYGFVPWFDETFGQWEEVILASAKLPLLIIDSIAENLPEVENRVVENGYELFYLKMDRLAGNRIFFEAMSELA